MKKLLGLLILLAVLGAAPAFAMNWFSYPAAIDGSHVLLNTGAGLGISRIGHMYIPPLIFAADFPVSIAGLPFSFGTMSWFSLNKWKDIDNSVYYFQTIIMTGRADFHFPLDYERIDVYAGTDIGLEIGIWNKSNINNNYFWSIVALHGGIRYFFAKNVGVYAETGIGYYKWIHINGGICLKF